MSPWAKKRKWRQAALWTAVSCSLAAVAAAHTPAVPSPPMGVTLLDAIKSTLLYNPALRIQQRQTDINRGIIQNARGQFDTQFGANFERGRTYTPLTAFQQAQALQAGITASSQLSNLTNYGLTSSKQFRSGVTVTTGLATNRILDNLFNAGGVTASTLSFTVDVPLLRGRGTKYVDANEMAAQHGYEASLLDLNQAISQLIENTAEAYWGVVAARRTLAVLRGSETRGKTFITQTRALVQAGRVSAAEMNGVMANLEARITNRVSAEQALTQAQLALGYAMGLSAQQVAQLPSPDEPFPKVEIFPDFRAHPNLTRRYIALALARRGDYLAVLQRVQAASVLRGAARNNLKPLLNLSFTSGYSGLSEGRSLDPLWSAPYSHVGGPNVIGGVTLQFPPRNDAARGLLTQALASYQQAQLASEDSARAIATAVLAAMDNVRRSSQAVQHAQKAVSYYRAALTGENEKYRLGRSTLVDLFTYEDRLTAALQQEIAAQQSYAIAVAQFRFATGTYLAPGQFTNTLRREDLITVPTLPLSP